MDARQALDGYRMDEKAKSLRPAVESFNKLSVEDKMELLFWMAMVTNHTLHHFADRLGLETSTNFQSDERVN